MRLSPTHRQNWRCASWTEHTGGCGLCLLAWFQQVVKAASSAFSGHLGRMAGLGSICFDIKQSHWFLTCSLPLPQLSTLSEHCSVSVPK